MRLRRLPEAIAVSGIVIGYIVYIEARNAARKIARRARKAFGP